MQTIRKYLPGMAVCLAIAVPSWLLGKLVPVIGGTTYKAKRSCECHSPVRR